MALITVIDSRGNRTPFNSRNLLGSMLESGIPRDLALDRVNRLVDIINVARISEVTTDGLRHALEEIAVGATPSEVAAAFLIHPSPLIPTAPLELVGGDLAARVVIQKRLYVDVEYQIPYRTPPMYLFISDTSDSRVYFSLIPLYNRKGTLRLPVGWNGIPEGRWFSLCLTTAAGHDITRTPIFVNTPFYPGLLLNVDDPDDLVKKVNDLINEIERLIKLLDFFPTYRLARLLRLLAKLIAFFEKVSPKVWIALIDFLGCKNEALVDLTVADLKLLVEVLLEQAKAELELEEDTTKKQSLEAWIKKLEELLRRWDDSWAREKAVEAVAELKKFLQKYYPEILTWLLSYFGDDVRREIEELVEQLARGIAGKITKRIIRKIIERILVKRLGEEAAKRLFPLVGIALTLAEFISVMAMIEHIEDLQKQLHKLLRHLIGVLVKDGFGWPSPDNAHVWFENVEGFDWTGAKVTLCAFVRCARPLPEGCTKFGDPCRIKFLDKGHCFDVTLDDSYRKRDGYWEVPFEFDLRSIEKSPCVKGEAGEGPPIACYTFVKCTATLTNGKVIEGNILIGAKEF